jgi:hypothetical protein
MTQLVEAKSHLSSPRRRGSSWLSLPAPSSVERVKQVIPVRIALLDQSQFPAPVPFLERLFAGDGVADIGEGFDMNQPCYSIFLGEGRTPAVSMREDASGKVVGDADVESPVALAGENIDMVALKHGLF